MDEQVILDFARQAVYTVIISASPLLIIALSIGLLVSIFQTVTSIQEQTLAFVPKVLGIFVGVLVFGPYIGRNLLEFFTNTMQSMNQFIR